MATITAKQLLEERAELIAKARKINDEHADAEGNLAPEYQQQFDTAMSDAGDLMTKSKRYGSLEAAEASLSQIQDNPGIIVDPMSGTVPDREMVSVRANGKGANGAPLYEQRPAGSRGSAEYRNSFEKYLQNGAAGLSGQELAALQSDNATQAGYLVASEQLAAGILKGVDDLVFVRQHARIHTVPEADSLGIRKRATDMSTFAWSSELAVSTADSSLAYGKKVLTPHPLTGEIKVSRDLLRRSMGTAEAEVRYEMARDSAAIMETAYLTGNGAQQPLGVFTASSDGISTGRDVLTGSTTTFTADQLVAAKYTLKQQYRNGGSRGGARWLFHRDGINKISQLKDGDNHYMLQPARGLTGDEWDTMLGYPVDESELAPNTFTASLYVGLLANWEYYEIADALDLEVQVLDQLYAGTNQVGYIGRLKTDGMPTLEEAFVRLKTSAS